MIDISVKDLKKSFEVGHDVLSGLSFEINAGEHVGILGANGSGKTTLFRLLTGEYSPDEGSISIHRGRRIGLISHRPMLYGDLSAEENLAFFSSLYAGEPDRERIDALLSLVELDHRRHDPVRTYSRGMQQRLSIARALVNDPGLVLLDEPYSGLDPHAAELFDELIARARAERPDRTFIMVSHDLEKGFDLCTHALLLARGQVVLMAEKAGLDRTAFRELYLATVGMGVA